MAQENLKTGLKLRGRDFSKKEIGIIQKQVERHFTKGRTFISVEVCKKIDWKQPNGWLKDRACREVLRILETKKIIKLPPSKLKRKDVSKKKIEVKTFNVEDLAKNNLKEIDFDILEFHQVKGTKEEIIWNQIVNEYHYLGFKTFVGRSLKYLVYYEGKIVSAIGFCDPAWKIEARDNLLKKDGLTESDIRWQGINNGRFLILPWLKIPNLASFLLSKLIKIAIKDWELYYGVKPIYIETFVHSKKFLGTCYKADNWKHIGTTKGYKKSGSSYSNSQVPKFIFIKVLNKKNFKY